MIAEKLLACATPALLDPGNTLFLANWQAVGAAHAQIGRLNDTGAAATSPGVLSLYGDVVGSFDVQAGGLDSWVIDLFFDGSSLPSISAPAAVPGLYLLAVVGGSSVLLSADGSNWAPAGTMPAAPAGRNHIALGRQGGAMQAWLNGVRFIYDATTAVVLPAGAGSGTFTIYAGPTTIGPMRIVGADIYGDSANITVPTLPLGIV